MRSIKPGNDWHAKAIQVVADRLGERDLQGRLAQAKTIAGNMDKRFDMGFMDMDSYLVERQRVQAEIDLLIPLVTMSERLHLAASILNDFDQHWLGCTTVEEQHELLRFIVKEVHIRDYQVTKIVLTSDYQLVAQAKS